MTSEAPDGTLLVDFAGLAANDADFGKILSAKSGYIDFQDAATVQQLTKSILKRHFKLKVELPDDRLCPPVPIRHEYIRWLQGLIDTTSSNYSRTFEPTRAVTSIDIGTGASCIYPLLGCSSRTNWQFHASDVDDKSFASAQHNVALNNLEGRIHLHKTTSDGPLLPLNDLGIDHADFTMCNPPFFTSKNDMQATHLTKKRSPSAVCSGADVEMITEGGDLGFVMRILEESMQLRGRVQWYSSMLGKLSSAVQLVEALKERGISNFAVTSLQAGNVTKRWAVAWSFQDFRPRNDIARRHMHDKQLLPFPTDYKIETEKQHKSDIRQSLDDVFSDLDVVWSWDETTASGLCRASDNVWSRSARRKRRKLDVTGGSVDVSMNDTNATTTEDKLVVKITIMEAAVVLEWLKGPDTVLFESFCGFVKRALTTTTSRALP